MLRSASASCVLAMIKRMEAQLKLNLLDPSVEPHFVRLELVTKLPALIIGYASEALDCYKRSSLQNSDGSALSMELLEESLPSVFYVMQNCEELDSGNMVQFLSDYITTIKMPSQKQAVYIGQILEVIQVQISYDPAYRSNLVVPDKIGKEKEDQMAEHRKDYFTLFRSMCRVAPDVTQLFIRNSIANALSSSEMNVEEAEAALALFYRLGETVSEEGMRSGSGLLCEIVPMLLSAKFSCHSHRLVALAYLETITRYLKYVQENGQYIPNVLAAFLDDRGVHHTNLNVSRRACYLFMRAVKLLKSQLVPYSDSIFQSLLDMLAQYTSSDWMLKDQKCSGFEDGSHAFEAIGLLIGVEEIPLEKQLEYLAALLKPLYQQIEVLLLNAKAQGLEESSTKVLSLERIIVALNALSKGFSERTLTASRPAIGLMFKQTLDVLLQILATFPNIKTLRTKVTSYLHRMVEILGIIVMPYLPMALNQMLLDCEPREMVDFFVLVNQLVCKFGTSLKSILEEIFPTIASRVFMILSRNAFPSGPGSNNEEVRELQELQRISYSFIHIMVTHDLSSVFLTPNSQGYLDAIMQLLLITSCNHKDVLVRKTCVQVFVKLIKDWCSKQNGEDKVPGFRTFIIEKFASSCCFYSVLDKSFEFRDANTLVLFGEIVLAQKVMYERLGDEFMLHFVSKVLPSAHCPRDLAEQYYQCLQGNDNKAFKAFYQSLVVNLRQQQNGSLVFR
ncbi:hypothetical protein HPP92_026306 [Vanilla planifolia]|uniref:Exportin-T n=1 Tax=Vanilla planifolia TaxID=51239 RepID=A0A835PK31_VANPL|nr:hypothetical protein HPP92_026306 [Vanilla planifolia]